TPTSWSATSIVAPVPAGATSGNVVVTVSGAASNGAAFTVQTSVAAIAFVQGNSATPQAPQATVKATYTKAQVAGDTNVVVVGWNDATALATSVTDTKGNVYTLAVGPTILAGALSQSIYYAKNIAAAAANGNVVTVKFNVAAAFPDIRILEYSGLDRLNPFDIGDGRTGNSLTSTSPSVTTTNPNDLLVGANMVLTGTIGAGTG